jgi:hypothetical protein
VAWQAQLEAIAVEHKKRVAAAKREAEAGRRRQKAFLASIGVEDVTPQEISERARHPG